MRGIASQMEKLCYVRTQSLEVSPDIIIIYTYYVIVFILRQWRYYRETCVLS